LILLEELLKNGYLIYFLNDIGAWKLHNSPGGSSPIIKVIVSDLEKEYLFKCESGNAPRIIEEGSSDVDIELTFNALILLIDEENDTKMIETIKYFLESGKISFKINSEINTLGAKGYLALLNELGISLDEINFSPYDFEEGNYKFVLLTFLILVIFIFLIVKYWLKSFLQKI